ncbi:L-cysteine:1D-myo-inositol 2-amino-2-deoxy-alpha-D-glucopyranoside ligase [Nocardioides albertanoniae]|uniref:L-cysteine:1D-myo-inositol 2-amino-2-deoxy-alpha-D-glucopyranoside ligase n=1 Tax=Nocardioides albertanoniae TaxID=1175486 RepID=A0A543A889_9ACTN|nr:cysteine--1-D-myo-inosityl 2-amino-2-deoxy-alpha-D-glucopyranoside ligase [Nocardioides albertanoniae]TQL68813.1 L-cysteine:1D-myo-inositol 2-amino-2-deoxy-alpha-D-glucopyranoside ligase [Nocardioides albertanoniae]
MRAWSAPDVPELSIPGPEVELYDHQRDAVVSTAGSGRRSLYVCGITPYDATHMGHANTYVAFDLLHRAWRNAGYEVDFTENVTDVDDPLLERAEKVGIEWEALAERETELFRQDMEALRVISPQHYVGAVESIPLVVSLIGELEAAGATYKVDDDVYASVAVDDAFGDESRMDRKEMLAIFGERGGDPDRGGKKDPLDALLWRAERPGEPSWPSPWGPGRPGWHVECTAIALEHLGAGFTVQAGGSDLVFPHHEMSGSHARSAGKSFADIYTHGGMVAYDGHKMSKSRGNLVFVSALRNSEIDPMAIRLVLLGHHYRDDWEWTDAKLFDAVDKLAAWRKAVTLGRGAPAAPVVETVLGALADDLDAPRAVQAIDAWVAATLGEGGLAETSDPLAGESIAAVVDAALGIKL